VWGATRSSRWNAELLDPEPDVDLDEVEFDVELGVEELRVPSA